MGLVGHDLGTVGCWGAIGGREAMHAAGGERGAAKARLGDRGLCPPSSWGGLVAAGSRSGAAAVRRAGLPAELCGRLACPGWQRDGGWRPGLAAQRGSAARRGWQRGSPGIADVAPRARPAGGAWRPGFGACRPDLAARRGLAAGLGNGRDRQCGSPRVCGCGSPGEGCRRSLAVGLAGGSPAGLVGWDPQAELLVGLGGRGWAAGLAVWLADKARGQACLRSLATRHAGRPARWLADTGQPAELAGEVLATRLPGRTPRAHLECAARHCAGWR